MTNPPGGTTTSGSNTAPVTAAIPVVNSATSAGPCCSCSCQNQPIPPSAFGSSGSTNALPNGKGRGCTKANHAAHHDTYIDNIAKLVCMTIDSHSTMVQQCTMDAQTNLWCNMIQMQQDFLKKKTASNDSSPSAYNHHNIIC